MDRAFQRLVVRTRPLGNHAVKYLRTVEKHGERLLACLEVSGRLSRVHVDRVAPSLADDFDQVFAAGRDRDETLVLLGTYYAIQFLHQNVRSLERLAVDLAEKPDRRLSFRIFIRRVEDAFFRLVSTYIRRVIRVILPPPPPAPYLLCAVGTRGHQDDIDVAVIDQGGNARPALDHAFAKLTGQMLRHSSALDHYLAGRVGTLGYCVSLEELQRALCSPRPDFVVVTELLRAEPLAGSRTLLRKLRQEVIAEYCYRPGMDNTRHELYLRGILGEIRSLLVHPPSRGSINAKDDGLRLLTGMTSAMKTIDDLEATQPRDLIRQVRGRRPSLRTPLGRLEDSLVFLETFRHLHHVLVTEEDEVQVEGEVARENLERVARAMGYRDRGPVHATDHMLVHYHEAVETIHRMAVPLMDEVARHLSETSRFSPWMGKKLPESSKQDLVREFALGARAFRGARFWDDLLKALAAPDGELLAAFVESFSSLPEVRRSRLAAEYAEWGCDAPYALLNLITLLAGRRRIGQEEGPAAEITHAFLERLGTHREYARSLSRVFRFYPDLTNRFLLTLEEESLGRLRESLEGPIGDPEVAAARDRYQELIDVHLSTSRYLKRVLARVTMRHPAAVQALPDPDAMQTLAQGRLAEGERHPNPAEQKGLLGDFYDMEFLRIAMGTLRGVSRSETCAAFTELTRTYLGLVFGVCLRETEREAGRRIPKRDLLAIYLTGGHARNRPYDEDYDLLVLIDSDDPEARALAEKSVAMMNRQIAHRGVIAQYRMGDRLGRFVTGLDELADFLAKDEDDRFVELCQLLGSRMVTGSRRVERELVDRILRPFIFEQPDEFIERVARELRERREAHRPLREGFLHLKETPGGLREIDLSLAVVRARLGLREPGGESLFDLLISLDPQHAESFRALGSASNFLVQMRSVYRLTVAASDVIERRFLERPARVLGYETESGDDAATRLFGDIEAHITAGAQAVEDLVPGLV